MADVSEWGRLNSQEKQAYETASEAWPLEIKKAQAARLAAPVAPRAPAKSPLNLSANLLRYYQATYDPVKRTYDIVLNSAVATGFHNAMIHPVTPYAIRGALWYQGENNVNRPDTYRFELPALIRSWRREWGQGDFPFLLVQLARYLKPQQEPVERGWAELREAQMQASLTVPNTAMASAIDLGEADDIHASDKEIIGQRLAAAALKLAYGGDLEYEGPIYQRMAVEGGQMRITFSHVGSGLIQKGERLDGFAIAGSDGKFVWAEAHIEGGAVVVSSKDIKEPKQVRYAWASNPRVSLYNREGFPASSFRTDQPPLPMQGR
jgi:sialate O-acetylesterase